MKVVLFAFLIIMRRYYVITISIWILVNTHSVSQTIQCTAETIC